MTGSAAARQHHIDNLRNLAVLALILFHTARLFDSEAWQIKDAASYPWADLVVRFFNPWQMPLLFLLAGASATYSLRKREVGVFIGERANRLMVTLAAGIFLTVLPQVYIERISPYVLNRSSPIDLHNVSLLEFIPRFFGMKPYPAGDFSWHHLWFLLYLFIYSVLLAPLLSGMARSDRAEHVGAWLAKGWRPLLPVVPIAIFEVLLRPHFPITNNLVRDWANHANYVTVLLVGGLFAASPSFAEGIRRMRRVALLVALPLTLVWLGGSLMMHGAPDPAMRLAIPLLRAILEWSWIVALTGYARVLLDRQVPLLTGFTPYALPFYVFHQLIIVWLGWLSFGWSDMPLVKYAAIAVAALVISYALARLCALTAVTRFLLGMKMPRPPGAPPAPAGSAGVKPAGSLA